MQKYNEVTVQEMVEAVVLVRCCTQNAFVSIVWFSDKSGYMQDDENNRLFCCGRDFNGFRSSLKRFVERNTRKR